MKVQELVSNMHNDNFNLTDALQVKKYLPIEVKKVIAQSILYECTNDDAGATSIDSVQKYMAYVRHMITTHTCLEYVDDDYDTLFATEYDGWSLLDAIFECFDRDAEECEAILDAMTEDYIRELSLEFSIAKLVNEIGSAIGKLSEQFNAETLANILPQDLDVDKINSLLNQYVK